MLAGGDQPVGAGQGEVVLGAVPGISEEQRDEAVPPGGGVLAWRVRGAASLRGLVRGDQGAGGGSSAAVSIGPNQAVSVVSWVSWVAMISPSAEVTFWAL